MKIKKWKFLNQLGLSAVEIVVGGALFAGVSLMVAKNIENQNKVMTKNKEVQGIETTIKNMSDAFKRKSACEAILKNLNTTELASSKGIVITEKSAKEQGNSNCISPGEKPSQRYTEEEYKKLLKSYEINYKAYLSCKKSNVSPKVNCQKPDEPSLKKYSDSEYYLILKSFDKKVASYNKCVSGEGGGGGVAGPIAPAEIQNWNHLPGRKVDAKTKLKEMNMKLSNSTGLADLKIRFEFEQNRFEKINDTKKLTQSISVKRDLDLKVFIKDGVIDCDSYDGTKIANDSMSKLCTDIGGTYDSGTGDCDVTSIDPVLREKLKESVCASLNKNSANNLDGSKKCSVIDLQGKLILKNISPNALVINGDKRAQFDNSTCGNYLKGHEVIGAKNCGDIIAPFGDGSSVVAPPPPPIVLDCDKDDKYSLTAMNSASDTNSCQYYDSYPNVAGDACTSSTTNVMSAGECKFFRSATCSGKKIGVIDTYTDGTSCGLNKTCQSGSCETTPIVATNCSATTYSIQGEQFGQCQVSVSGLSVGNSKPYTYFTTSSGGACDEKCGGASQVEGVGGEFTASCTAAGNWNFIPKEDCECRCKVPQVTKVDCVGSFVANGTCVKTKADCSFWKDIQGFRDSPATFKITTAASGGGNACAYKDGDAGTTRCGICACFIAGTEILMADGTYKNIEDVIVGDKLRGSNNSINTVLILKPNNHSGKKYSINGSGYFVTEGHPFMTQDGWKAFNPTLAMEINPTLSIGKLSVGDYIVRENTYEKVNMIDYTENDERVYNFELDGTKDYYADGFLVHNK